MKKLYTAFLLVLLAALPLATALEAAGTPPRMPPPSPTG